MSNDQIESTNTLLKVIIALLVRVDSDTPRSMRDQISTLSGLGLKPSEIAGILGRTGTYVNKELSALRKETKSDKKK